MIISFSIARSLYRFIWWNCSPS